MVLLVDNKKLPKNFSAFSPKKQLNLCFNLKEPIHIVPVQDLDDFEVRKVGNK